MEIENIQAQSASATQTSNSKKAKKYLCVFQVSRPYLGFCRGP